MQNARRPSVWTTESLGKVVFETKPNVSNLVAGVILGVLSFGGGLAICGFMVRQIFFAGGNRPQALSDWLGAALLVVLAIALMVGGVLLVGWVHSIMGLRVRVCGEGFYCTRKGVDMVFAWDEIVQVRETVLHEKLPLVKGAARRVMPIKTSRHYTVVRCDGEEFFFDQNVIPRTSLLAGPLSAAAKNRGISWETKEETA